MATVNKQMTIGEVLSLDRSTASVFMNFGMFCLSCPHATAESLEDACIAHGTDANDLVEKLNEHLAEKG